MLSLNQEPDLARRCLELHCWNRRALLLLLVVKLTVNTSVAIFIVVVLPLMV